MIILLNIVNGDGKAQSHLSIWPTAARLYIIYVSIQLSLSHRMATP